MPHLVVAISAHGFGHVAQTAPVVNRLRQLVPGLRVTVRSMLPEALLRARFDGPCTFVPAALDIGMCMASGLDVQVEESAHAYAGFHHAWPSKVDAEARALTTLAPDLVLADVPYLTLAGAARAGLPAVALCSLHWADIYRHYFGQRPEARTILIEMQAAYASAACFFQPAPSMPMADLANRRPIGPIARIGEDRRDAIRASLGLPATTRLALLAPGGVPLPLDLGRWPRRAALHWLVPQSLAPARPDMSPFELLEFGFTDVLKSMDAVIGKPGYGTFTEAACNGTPMLYVRRSGWPEEPYLVEWLVAKARALEIPRAALESGELGDALDTLWSLPETAQVAPDGIEDAAQAIARGWLATGAAPVRAEST